MPLSSLVSSGGGVSNSLNLYPGIPSYFVKGKNIATAGYLNRIFNFGEFLIGIGNSGASVYKSSTGRTWTAIACAITAAQTFAAYDHSHDSLIVVGWDGGGGAQGHPMVSFDGGETFTSYKAALAAGASPNNINGVGVQSGSGLVKRIILAQDNIQFPSYSDDGGITWAPCAGNIDVVNRTLFVMVHAPGVSGTGLWMTFYAGQCYTSINNGNTWVAQAMIGLAQVYALIWVQRLNGGNGLWIAVGNGNGVYTSIDDGANWTQYAATALGVNYTIHDSGAGIIVVGANGDWITSTDGETWTVQSTSKFTTNLLAGVTSLKSHWLFADNNGNIWSGVNNLYGVT